MEGGGENVLRQSSTRRWIHARGGAGVRILRLTGAQEAAWEWHDVGAAGLERH